MILPVLAVLSVYAPGQAHAATPTPARPLLHSYSSVSLSSAGDMIASVEQTTDIGPEPNPASKARHGAVIVRSAADGRIVARYDPCATCSYDALTWAHHSDGLAFLAHDETAGTAVAHVVRGAHVTAIATVKGAAQGLKWSPDDGQLAMLATPDARKAAGATQAGVPQVGEIGARFDEQRLAVVSASGGALRLLTPDDAYVYEYDWTPDAKALVFTGAKGDGDANWWVAELQAVDVATTSVRTLARPKLQMNDPRVSPDGRSVAFIGGLMSDFGSVGGDVYIVALSGGAPENLTPGFRGSFTSLTWTTGGLAGTALIGDRSAVMTSAGAKAPTHVAWSAPASFSAGEGGASFSADGGRVAMSAQDYTHAPHLYAGAVNAPVAITHENDTLSAKVSARSLTWRSDGREVQGWLIGPPLGADSAASSLKPMIVDVHGGPSAASTPHYVARGLTLALIDAGYYVFEPNPRGSYGQGEAFVRANVKDFGGGDLRDILAGVDAALKAAPIDPTRVGVTGVSYGGFMTMYAVTHTDRFKAGVAGAGVADWFSYYGQNGIHQWMLPFFGASAYDDPALYTKLSPMDAIKKAKTPTFIWVGERDIECPPAQSVEFFNGLREMNVPTSLVIYAGEGHGLRKPDDSRDAIRRTLDWFARYMSAAG